MSSKPLVVDNGTGFVKCGFAGDNFPHAIFPRSLLFAAPRAARPPDANGGSAWRLLAAWLCAQSSCVWCWRVQYGRPAGAAV